MITGSVGRIFRSSASTSVPSFRGRSRSSSTRSTPRHRFFQALGAVACLGDSVAGCLQRIHNAPANGPFIFDNYDVDGCHDYLSQDNISSLPIKELCPPWRMDNWFTAYCPDPNRDHRGPHAAL